MLVDNQLSLSFKNVLQLNRNLVVFQTKIYYDSRTAGFGLRCQVAIKSH